MWSTKERLKCKKAIDEGAAKLVELLKPALKKILTLVQSKLKKDDGKEEKEESKKKKTEIGDYITQWRFDKTAIGGKFYNALGDKDARAALENLKDEFDKAVEDTLEEKMKAGLAKLIGDKNANMEIVALILEAIANQVLAVLKRFTTIKPLMEACKPMFAVRAQMEKDIIAAKGDKAAADKVIDAASVAMWKTFPEAGLLLFSKVDKLKDHIQSEFRNLPDEAVSPLTDIADKLYDRQMSALNSLRTQLILGLKTKLDAETLKSEDNISNVIRTSFRELTFSIIHIITVESWKGIAENIITSAIVQAKNKFDSDVWPTIASGLEEIQKLLPDEITSMGLQIEPLAKAVAMLILEKGVKWALTKFVIKLELALFEQAGTVLNM